MRADEYTHWKLSVSVVDGDGAQTGRQPRPLDRLVECPDLQHWFVAQVLLFEVSTFDATPTPIQGSIMRTETVTSKLVPSTWSMCVMRPVSCAWKLRTTFQLGPMMRTYPLSLPRNRLSEPEHTLDISLFSKKDRVSSSPSLTWLTSKKSNAFH